MSVPLERKIRARITVVDEALLRRRFIRAAGPVYDLNKDWAWWCGTYSHPDRPDALFDIREALQRAAVEPVMYWYQLRYCRESDSSAPWLYRIDLHAEPPFDLDIKPHTHEYPIGSHQRTDAPRPVRYRAAAGELLDHARIHAGPCIDSDSAPKAPDDCRSFMRLV